MALKINKNLTFDFGNSTNLFKLLMYVSDEEFTAMNDYLRAKDFDKFKTYSKVLLERYFLEIKETHINPAIVRSKLTTKLIPIDLEFLREVSLAER